MDITITWNKPINVMNFLRQVGYHPIHDYQDSKDSWVRNLGSGHYPRFHLYTKGDNRTTTFSLHIDQKQHTMEVPGVKRHAGEYDSAVVQQEGNRLQRWIQYAQSSQYR
ncbi:MAG: hypothetical protein HY565_00955 [Candidatus Kerfeldbacteria bacterium]|nr:hypothetical protein [Candidatus Kerfeldbacteria bacterium]